MIPIEVGNQESIVSQNEEHLLNLGRGKALDYVDYTLVHYQVEKHVYKKPAELAVVSTSDEISYLDFYIWAAHIAMELSKDNIGPNKRVAVLVNPSAAMIAALFGIIQSGAACLPLDFNQPDERITAILDDAGVSAVVVDDSGAERLSKFEIPLYSVGAVSRNINSNSLSEMKTIKNISLCKNDHAYVIYTSGSTGEPKGVLISHEQIFNSTHARNMVYPRSPTFLMISPLACDSSMAGIWGTLTTGGKLVVASQDEVRDPEKLIELINKFMVTQLLCVPSLYEAMLEIAERRNISMTSLDTIIVAGEALRQSLVQKHFEFHGGAVSLVNEYGPTECTIWASYYKFTTPEPVSIGGPIPGVKLYVLDKDLRLVSEGEIGELFIGGSQVAIGYFGRPEATEEAFLPDHFSTMHGARMYRTGDLVRWNKVGTLDFIGRKDHQIKIRGYRIEASAVELAICNFSGVRDAVVMANTDSTLLLAFILTSTNISVNDLREQLARELPNFMMPSNIVTLDHFPRTMSGKIDRNFLKLEYTNLVNDSQMPAESSQPTKISDGANGMAERVALAWRELLKINSVPHDVNFFDLGGHSLMIFKLQDSLEKHTGKRPTVVSLFRHTTILAQSKLLDAEYVNINDFSSKQNLEKSDSRRKRGVRLKDLKS